MGKSYYSDFVNHCLRFYCRYPNKPAKQPDLNNWLSADGAVKSLSAVQQTIVIEVYSSRQTMNEAVCESAKAHGATLDEVWQLVKLVERKTAEIRGLV